MTDTLSPQQAIYDLAPYPDPQDATAANMARYFTVQSFASHCRLYDHPVWNLPREHGPDGKATGAYEAGLRGYHRDVELAWTQYVAAWLLRCRAGLPMDLSPADALQYDEHSGELASESVGEWLSGYGIDAEVIVRAVRAERAVAA